MSQFPPRAFIRMAAELDAAGPQTSAPGPDVRNRQVGLRFLSLRDVLDRLTISRSLLYELIKDPVQPFPTPIHLGRRSVWVEQEVEDYMRAVLATARP
ncbi:MAG: AlpA family phage regulatory protein [Hyphomonas sp.]|nr:AlpA family phage regulatory protein [Hyphomonas sp.]MBU3920560.1 AlpA family phage regulatory protein [Alphaproteobacteria bacterium]MBU4062462.1 AlpA family phage regulatory protein [Alphaproteobacteria bacterium]MBU4165420.1 AlpA family phage regulatory protein [Alphaproteobacteria bacterium]